MGGLIPPFFCLPRDREAAPGTKPERAEDYPPTLTNPQKCTINGIVLHFAPPLYEVPLPIGNAVVDVYVAREFRQLAAEKLSRIIGICVRRRGETAAV